MLFTTITFLDLERRTATTQSLAYSDWFELVESKEG